MNCRDAGFRIWKILTLLVRIAVSDPGSVLVIRLCPRYPVQPATQQRNECGQIMCHSVTGPDVTPDLAATGIDGNSGLNEGSNCLSVIAS